MERIDINADMGEGFGNYRIGNDEELSIVDSARLVHQLAGTGKELKINFIPMNQIFGKYKDLQRRLPDLSKAKKILGFSPKVRLKEYIKLTIEKHKEKIASTPR